MSHVKSMLVALALAAAVGVAFVAAQSTKTPGEPTQARVWVENRGGNEAIPVSVERFGSTPSVHVSSVDASVVLLSRAARQQWEYRTVAYDAGALIGAGNEGWEAVGMVQTNTGGPGVSVLLKRPR